MFRLRFALSSFRLIESGYSNAIQEDRNEFRLRPRGPNLTNSRFLLPSKTLDSTRRGASCEAELSIFCEASCCRTESGRPSCLRAVRKAPPSRSFPQGGAQMRWSVKVGTDFASSRHRNSSMTAMRSPSSRQPHCRDASGPGRLLSAATAAPDPQWQHALGLLRGRGEGSSGAVGRRLDGSQPY